MVVFLSKSDTSEGFDQIVDFLHAHTIQYALVVNPTIYVSCIKQFWATAIVKKVNDNVQLCALIDDKKVVVSEAIIRRDLHLDNADRCLSAKRTAWYEFSYSMASTVICLATDNQVADVTTHNTRYTSPTLTHKVFANMMRVGKGLSGVDTPLFASMLVPSPPQAEDKVEMHAASTQPSPTTEEEGKEARKEKEIKAFRVQKAEKDGGEIEAIDADEGITLVDVETNEEVVAMDAKSQGRSNQEDVSTAEPIVFDEEDVTMTMAQTLIKLKAEKAKLLDEHIAQKLHDKESDVAEQVQERHLDAIKKYQNLKKKPLSIAQARKNMIIYLKNMAGYKMEYFKGMNYNKARPIFERKYKKECFKKLRADEVLGSESTQEKPSNDPKEMTEEDVQNIKRLSFVKCCHDPDAEWKITNKDNVVQRLKENAQRNYYCWINITAGSTLVLLDKVDAVVEVLKNLL
nr:hypothetical protein [Tanacetum cinerariifolium]